VNGEKKGERLTESRDTSNSPKAQFRSKTIKTKKEKPRPSGRKKASSEADKGFFSGLA